MTCNYFDFFNFLTILFQGMLQDVAKQGIFWNAQDLKLKDGGMNPLILLMIGINLLLIT